jgi:hypothetical protein
MKRIRRGKVGEMRSTDEDRDQDGELDISFTTGTDYPHVIGLGYYIARQR